MSSSSPSQPTGPRDGEEGTWKAPRSRRGRKLRARAFSHLNKAIDAASGQLSSAWVEQGDPDLKSLRGKDPDWPLVINRLGSNHLGDSAYTEVIEGRISAEEVEGRVGPHEAEPARAVKPRERYKSRLPERYPQRPWGDPDARAWRWGIVVVVSVVVVAGLDIARVVDAGRFGGSEAWTIGLTLVALFSAWQFWKALRESRFVRCDPGPGRKVDDGEEPSTASGARR
jgi:hypothetical protein